MPTSILRHIPVSTRGDFLLKIGDLADLEPPKNGGLEDNLRFFFSKGPFCSGAVLFFDGSNSSQL